MSPPPPGARGKTGPSLLFVVGHPVSHSLSPAMHNGIAARLGLPLYYFPVDLPPGRLPDFLRLVREANFLGGNVTIPYKEEAAALSDTRSDAVLACGAANVLVARSGRIHAENTDGDGFIDALEGRGWGRRFPEVVLLGAGGAARGIAFALGKAGARRILLLNRTPRRAEEVARALSPRLPSVVFSTGDLATTTLAGAFRGADLIVQCTSLGLREEWENFPIKGVEKSSRFADIVYRTRGTALVRRLRARGVPTVDGLPMLAHQAARSFTLWTGRRIPGASFLALARKALKI
ncbi:MAG: shikimate dehydrogenase [Deltaproteobacteria bacterium]|nr:MAG: shikimate dehydrogenase [Deltaproteobacteria bacterium]